MVTEAPATKVVPAQLSNRDLQDIDQALDRAVALYWSGESRWKGSKLLLVSLRKNLGQTS